MSTEVESRYSEMPTLRDDQNPLDWFVQMLWHFLIAFDFPPMAIRQEHFRWR